MPQPSLAFCTCVLHSVPDPVSELLRSRGVRFSFPKPVMNCLGPAYSGWALARLLLEVFQSLPIAKAKCHTRISAQGRQRVMPRFVVRGLPLAVSERRGIHRPNASLQGMLAGNARSQESLMFRFRARIRGCCVNLAALANLVAFVLPDIHSWPDILWRLPVLKSRTAAWIASE